MDLVTKLPAMADSALATLYENAERLEQSGTKAQRNAASALLPAIRTELENRRAAKLAAAKANREAAQAKRAAAKRAAKPKD